MHRRPFSLLVAIACLYLGSPPVIGRLRENWPYERLFKDADLVVIGTAVSTKDTADTFVDERWPLEFVGRDTALEVLQVLKGEAPGKRILVLHFQFGKVHKKAAIKGNQIVEIIDGPMLVSFRTKPEKIEVAGMELAEHTFEYLLFLKKRAAGRYEPVSGRIDPDLSIRELFGPVFSRNNGLGKGK